MSSSTTPQDPSKNAASSSYQTPLDANSYWNLEDTNRDRSATTAAAAAAADDDASSVPLAKDEILRIRHLLQKYGGSSGGTSFSFDDAEAGSHKSMGVLSANSDYTEFGETTHAWAIFADDPQKRASRLDRLVGTLIIMFQLFTYYIFAMEAIEDYQNGSVPVMITHANCIAANDEPLGDGAELTCQAEFTNNRDAAIAFSMLAIFLVSDFQQAWRAIMSAAGSGSMNPVLFACLAMMEVVCAFLAASVSISQKLYIGELTDAVEVGVGLLFIRELSTRAYHGISDKGKKMKKYRAFCCLLIGLVVVGLILDPIYESVFAPDDE